MSDLISRQDAIEVLIKCPGIGNRALDKIKALPSAEKKGKWIRGDQDKLLGRASCSVCNKWEYQASNFNFCPNCGADMRGEEE